MSLRNSLLKTSLTMRKKFSFGPSTDAYWASNVTSRKTKSTHSLNTFSTDLLLLYESRISLYHVFCSRSASIRQFLVLSRFLIVESSSSQVLRQTINFQFSIQSTFDSASFNQSLETSFNQTSLKHIQSSTSSTFNQASRAHSIKHLKHQSMKHLEHYSIKHFRHHSIKHLRSANIISAKTVSATSFYISAK
jgi:hypothetical protein